MPDERPNPFDEDLDEVAPDLAETHVVGSADDGSSVQRTPSRIGRPLGSKNRPKPPKTEADKLKPLIPLARSRIRKALLDPTTPLSEITKLTHLLLDRVAGKVVERQQIIADIDQRVATTNGASDTTPLQQALRYAFVHNEQLRKAVEAGEHPPLPPHEYGNARDRQPNMKLVAGSVELMMGHELPDPSVIDAEFQPADIEVLSVAFGANAADVAHLPSGSPRDADGVGATIASHEQARTGDLSVERSAAPQPRTLLKISEVESALTESPNTPDTDTPKYPPPPGHRIVEKFSDRVVMTTDENSAINTLYGVREITPGQWGWRCIQAGSPEMLEHLRLRGREESIRGEYAEPSL